MSMFLCTFLATNVATVDSSSKQLWTHLRNANLASSGTVAVPVVVTTALFAIDVPTLICSMEAGMSLVFLAIAIWSAASNVPIATRAYSLRQSVDPLFTKILKSKKSKQHLVL